MNQFDFTGCRVVVVGDFILGGIFFGRGRAVLAGSAGAGAPA
jgi:hypothetical protein